MEFCVRPIRPADIPRVLDIYAPYIRDTAVTFEYEVPTLSAFTERVERISGPFPWLVCEQDGVLVGYAYASPHHERAAYQWNADLSIYLSMDRRGCGIGSVLYRALLELLRLQGYRTVYALVTQPNEASMALHRRFGFSQAGMLQKSGYKFGAWRDVALLERELAAHDANPRPPRAFSELTKQELAGVWAQSGAAF